MYSKVMLSFTLFLTLLAAAAGFFLMLSSPNFGADYHTLQAAGRSLLEGDGNGDLLYAGALSTGLPFTYPPIAAIIFVPFALVPDAVGLFLFGLWDVVAAAALAWIVWGILTRRLQFTGRFGAQVGAEVGAEVDAEVKGQVKTQGAPAQTRWRIIGPALLAFAIALLGPWRNTFAAGDLNIVVFSLVLLDLLAPSRWWRNRGLLTGVMAGIKLTPLAFALYFLAKRDWLALRNMGVGFLGTLALAWLLRPALSQQFWMQKIFDTSRDSGPEILDNISLRGILVHLAGDAPWALWLWVLLALAVGVLGVLTAAAAVSESDILGAISAIAVVMLLISPLSWADHFVWIALVIPAVIHTVFRRSSKPGELTLGQERTESGHWRARTWIGVGALCLAVVVFYVDPTHASLFLFGSLGTGPALILASLGTFSVLALLITLSWFYAGQIRNIVRAATRNVSNAS